VCPDATHILGTNLVLGTDVERVPQLDQHPVGARQSHPGVAHVVDQAQSKQDAADVGKLLAELSFKSQ
jgi:hypothetical protein